MSESGLVRSGSRVPYTSIGSFTHCNDRRSGMPMFANDEALFLSIAVGVGAGVASFYFLRRIGITSSSVT